MSPFMNANVQSRGVHRGKPLGASIMSLVGGAAVGGAVGGLVTAVGGNARGWPEARAKLSGQIIANKGQQLRLFMQFSWHEHSSVVPL